MYTGWSAHLFKITPLPRPSAPEGEGPGPGMGWEVLSESESSKPEEGKEGGRGGKEREGKDRWSHTVREGMGLWELT